LLSGNKKEKVFPKNILLNDTFIESSTYQLIDGLAKDKYGNVIVTGQVDGTLKSGFVTGAKDVFINKMAQDGSLIWSVILNDNYPQINDSSSNETARSVYIDNASNSIYVAGATDGNFVENALGADIYVAKLNFSGDLIWLKHFGEDTQDDQRTVLSNPSLDWSGDELVAYMKLSDAGRLYISFQTTSSMFDINTTFGTKDIGIVELDISSGNIIKGFQLGQDESIPFSANTDGIESNTSNNFDFDGTKMVIPFSTSGDLAQTSAGGYDGAYIVLDSDLNLELIKQMGTADYNSWAIASGYSGGDLSGSEVFRNVTVTAPGEYLIYGKTGAGSNVAEPSSGSLDILFAKFVSNNLVELKQYGQLTLPLADGSEQPRDCTRASGVIYCALHTQADIFNSGGSGLYRPAIIKVDFDGNLLDGYRVTDSDSLSLGYSISDAMLVNEKSFIVDDGSILFSGKTYPVYTSTYIFKIDEF